MIGPPRRSLPPKKQIFHNSLFYCCGPGPCDSTILKIKAPTNQKSGVQIGYRKSLEICGELNLLYHHSYRSDALYRAFIDSARF